MRYAAPPQFARILVVAAAVAVVATTACSDGSSNQQLTASAAVGRVATQTLGCAACHGRDGQGLEGLGPSWKGIFGTEVGLEDGTTVRVDRDDLQRSILEPDADIVAGFTLPMPPYNPDPDQLEAVLDYLTEIK